MGFKISRHLLTKEEMREIGVTSASDPLWGTSAQNRAKFDELPIQIVEELRHGIKHFEDRVLTPDACGKPLVVHSEGGVTVWGRNLDETIDGLEQTAEAARKASEEARETAKSAEQTAETALSAAQDAKRTAEGIAGTAEDAKELAESAFLTVEDVERVLDEIADELAAAQNKCVRVSEIVIPADGWKLWEGEVSGGSALTAGDCVTLFEIEIPADGWRLWENSA